MLGQRRGRWPNIVPTLTECIVFTGWATVTSSEITHLYESNGSRWLVAFGLVEKWIKMYPFLSHSHYIRHTKFRIFYVSEFSKKVYLNQQFPDLLVKKYLLLWAFYIHMTSVCWVRPRRYMCADIPPLHATTSPLIRGELLSPPTISTPPSHANSPRIASSRSCCPHHFAGTGCSMAEDPFTIQCLVA